MAVLTDHAAVGSLVVANTDWYIVQQLLHRTGHRDLTLRRTSTWPRLFKPQAGADVLPAVLQPEATVATAGWNRGTHGAETVRL